MNPAKTGLVPARAGIGTIDDHDMWLTTRARIVLLTTEGVNLSDGVVETNHGVITLRGKVKTGAARAHAGLAVRCIDGVLGVRNFLQVADESSVRDQPELLPDELLPDELLKERLEDALKSDGKLDGLKVEGVNHGVIQMSGKGVTMTGRLRAVELAWNAAANDNDNDREENARPAKEKPNPPEGETK